MAENKQYPHQKLTPRVIIGSSLYFLGNCAFTGVWALLSVFIFVWFPYRMRYLLMTMWGRFNVRWLKLTCGVDWEVLGRENIPEKPCVVCSNHQSTWETLLLEEMFVPQVWVLKKEIFMIPFFGWGIRLLNPIAIDRKAKKRALQQLVDQSIEALAENRWVIIFPEGTRVKHGEPIKFKGGIGVLTKQTGETILPVVHNAGLYWPRGSFWKYPGKVVFSILPTTKVGENESSHEIVTRLESIVETELKRISA